MKINHRQPDKTANVSSARGTAGRELWKLMLSAAVLLVTLFFAIGWAVDIIVAQIPFETEARIFKNLSVPAATSPSETNQKHLQKAGNILATLRKVPNVPALPYQLVLIEEATPNAFAFPGGTLGVTTGLLDLLDEEIEVAFVLGHELGHFYNRDHLQGMGRAIGFRFILAAVFGGSLGSFGDMVEFVLQSGYSQDREKAADRYGLELVHAAYGKTEGVDRLFKILLEKSSVPGWAYMFSTHPAPAKRIEDLKAYAAALARKKDR